MPIYTRSGDEGETRIGTVRLRKDCDYTEVIGEFDELVSLLGEIVAEDEELGKKLEKIMRKIFEINAYLASGGQKDVVLDVKELEREIDEMWGTLPPLNRFVLRFTDPFAAKIHYARAVCRRVERRLVSFARNRRWVKKDVLAWTNRLSDWLFALARWINHRNGGKEITV